MREMKPEIAAQIQTSWFNRHARRNFDQFLDGTHRIRRYLEIGTFAGASLFWVLEHLRPDWTLAIDPYPADKKRSAAETGAIGDTVQRLWAEHYPHLEGLLRREPSEVVLPERLAEGDYYDAAYIDGSHHGADVFFDAALASRLLVPGGYLIFDDFGAGVIRNVRCLRVAVDAFQRTHHDRFDLIAVRHRQVWLRKREQPRPGRRPGLGMTILGEDEHYLGSAGDYPRVAEIA